MKEYQNLANAIVAQAAEDYRKDLRRIMADPTDREALKDALKIEQFFHSGWFGVLTGVDPDYLIDRLRKEALK